MDVFHILLDRPLKFDNNITYRGRDNMVMFILGTHKISMTSILHFDKNPGGKKSSF